MMEAIGKYKGASVFLDYDPSKDPTPWVICCCRSNGIDRQFFPNEEEAKAYAAGKYHLEVKRCAADPYMDWPGREDQLKIRGTAHWPEHRMFFSVDSVPDGTWVVARGNQGFSFKTREEALAFAAGRNWCGIKWYRSAREEQEERR